MLIYNGHLILGTDFDGVVTSEGIEISEDTVEDWPTLGATEGGSGDVFALAEYEGDLIAAGDFTSIDGVPANNIARWDGEMWHALGGGTDDTIHALMVYNGPLIAGGAFTEAAGQSSARVA